MKRCIRKYATFFSARKALAQLEFSALDEELALADAIVEHLAAVGRQPAGPPLRFQSRLWRAGQPASAVPPAYYPVRLGTAHWAVSAHLSGTFALRQQLERANAAELKLLQVHRGTSFLAQIARATGATAARAAQSVPRARRA